MCPSGALRGRADSTVVPLDGFVVSGLGFVEQGAEAVSGEQHCCTMGAAEAVWVAALNGCASSTEQRQRGSAERTFGSVVVKQTLIP